MYVPSLSPAFFSLPLQSLCLVLQQYYWHGSDSLATWGRIVMGSSMALDEDVTPTSATNPSNFESVADRIYLSALPYLLQVREPGGPRWSVPCCCPR
jgi:hypothetical protein